MDYHLLGRSVLKVPALCFGTGTFGGKGDFFSVWGTAEEKEATRMVDISTKGTFRFGTGPNDVGSSRFHL